MYTNKQLLKMVNKKPRKMGFWKSIKNMFYRPLWRKVVLNEMCIRSE